MKTLTLLLACLPFFAAGQNPNVTVQGDAKVGLIVTGKGNTINTTQIFGKSPEYAELKKALETLEADIQKKVVECDEMEKDSLPAKYRDACREEKIRLNARRDSVQKIEARFREDVVRLAETFSKMEINSCRLFEADSLFKIGKIREAETLLNFKEITQEGDALLAKKERLDSLLLIKANELALKAQLKATDYADSLRYDSAEMYFNQSLRYAESVDNLKGFAYLLFRDNRADRAVIYYESALKSARSENEEATLSVYLGVAYNTINKMPQAESMFLRSLEINERLAKSNPAQFEPDLLWAAVEGLGTYYLTIQKMSQAETTFLRSLEIVEPLAKSNPALFEQYLALTMMKLGLCYQVAQKMAQAETLYLRSFEINERLAKSNPAEFESDLAVTAMYLGFFYSEVQKLPQAESMYLRSLEIYERLVKTNPAQFEPNLGRTAECLAVLYQTVQKMEKAGNMYLRSLEIKERLAVSNPAQFEPELARTAGNLGIFYKTVQKMPEAERFYLRSLEIYERLAGSNPAQFEPDLAMTAMYLGGFYTAVQKVPEAERFYLRSLKIYERLAGSNSMKFEPELANLLNWLGLFYEKQSRLPEAQAFYSRSLTLQQKAVLAGQVHLWREANRPYSNLGNLRDSFALRGEWSVVADIEHERAACTDSLAPFNESIAKRAPHDYGSLSWYCLFARQNNEAIAAANRALTLDPAQNWVRTNLGHAHLLGGDWPKAKAIYEEYLKNETDPAEAKKTLLKDLDDLEAAGVTCPEVAKARAWLRE